MFWCSTFFTFSFVESWDLLTYCKAIEILDEVTGATAELNVKCRITLKKCCFVGRELEEIFIFVIGQSVKKTFSKIFPKLNLQMTVSFHLHHLILMTNIDNLRPAVEILPVIRWTLKRILKIFHMIEIEPHSWLLIRTLKVSHVWSAREWCRRSVVTRQWRCVTIMMHDSCVVTRQRIMIMNCVLRVISSLPT